jgi:hypothetical protein
MCRPQAVLLEWRLTANYAFNQLLLAQHLLGRRVVAQRSHHCFRRQLSIKKYLGRPFSFMDRYKGVYRGLHGCLRIGRVVRLEPGENLTHQAEFCELVLILRPERVGALRHVWRQPDFDSIIVSGGASVRPGPQIRVTQDL